MMENLTDLAAILIVRELRRRGRVFDCRDRQALGEAEIVVVPAEQNGLKQHRKETEPRGQPPGRAALFAHAGFTKGRGHSGSSLPVTASGSAVARARDNRGR